MLVVGERARTDLETGGALQGEALRVAYVLEVCETFIVDEINELRRQGHHVTVLNAFRPLPLQDPAREAMRRDTRHRPADTSSGGGRQAPRDWLGPVERAFIRTIVAVVRDALVAPAVAGGQPRLPDGLDGGRKGAVRMVRRQRLTAVSQVLQTALMPGVMIRAIRHPAVTDERAGVVGRQDQARVGEAAPLGDEIERRLRGGKHPLPAGLPVLAPARFVRHHHGTLADRGDQRLIRGLGALPHTLDRADDPPGRHRQVPRLPEQGRDLGDGQTQLGVQNRRQANRVWAELHGRGAQRIRGLQRVPALHPAPTVGAPPHFDAERAHVGPHRWEVFLMLADGMAVDDVAVAVRTIGRRRHVDDLVHVRRHGTVTMTAMRRARLASGPFRRRLRAPFRTRCRLALARATGGLQGLAQLRVLVSHPFELAFESLPFPVECLAVLPQALVGVRQVIAFAFESGLLASEAVVFTPQDLRRGWA